MAAFWPQDAERQLRIGEFLFRFAKSENPGRLNGSAIASDWSMEAITETDRDGAKAIRTLPQIPVAIVGYSHRLPGGIRTDEDFWRLLSEREIVQEPITDRYGLGYQPIGGFSGPGRFASPYEGLLREDEERLFDRTLFGISHNEMMAMDAQLRMLLSCAWETVERTGWDLHSLRNSATGVYIGGQVPSVSNWRPMRGVDEFSVTSISLAMLANRISYHFNLMGPSATYCTACSASLTALHSAMNALACGDCEQALVGSVNYLGGPRLSIAFNALGVISPSGKCHSFDADADGYMRSEGAFVFAVKPLQKAEEDGDRILAVVESTALNAAGAADGTSGLAQGRYITAPTRHAQVQLMRAARARACRSAAEIDYVEAHATGTVVGDRIEGNAIAEAFGGADRNEPVRISSVKSNLGHMEAAAFHCGLLKVILMMQRRVFAPTSKTFLVPNPEIDFDSSPIRVQTACEPFPERKVAVGINSFGFGGANGHCVVSEYTPSRPRIWSVPPGRRLGAMVPLSARTQEALVESARQLRAALVDREIDLHTLAGNLSRRRTHFAVRTSFAVRSRAQLIEALASFAEDAAPVSTAEEGGNRVAMVFSGQGTQWAGCGRCLYDADPVFRRAIDAVEGHWLEHSDFSLRQACFSAPQEELNEVQLAQPVIFMIQCALVELLKTWGVHPDCVIGHSSGEVAAAYASGALTLGEATRLVHHRATLQQHRAGSGRMLAIGLDMPGVRDVLSRLGVPGEFEGGRPPEIEIACENSPANTVICGREDALRPVMEALDAQNLQNVLLPGNIAFHSAAMDPIEDDFRSAVSYLDAIDFDLDVPFVSTVIGKSATRLDSAYWWSNVRQPVQFAAAMEAVQREYRPDIVLEIAPHCALQPTIAQCFEGFADPPVCTPTLMRDSDGALDFLQSLGALFRSGADLDFSAQYPKPEPISHLLPGHPRQEQAEIDIMCDDEMFVRQGGYTHGPLVGHKVAADHPLFEARLSERDFPWLTDHRVHHAPIMPAAGYIELVLEALEGSPAHFEEVEFLQPCPIPKKAVRLQTGLEPAAGDPDGYSFVISSRSYEVGSESVVHCRGRVRRTSNARPAGVADSLEDFDAGNVDIAPLMSGVDFYEQVEAILGEAFHYGPFFQTIQGIEADIAARVFRFDIELDEMLWASGQAEGFVLFPALLDGGFQIFLHYLMRKSDLFAIPQRALDLAFVRPPTSPRLTCLVAGGVDDLSGTDERGQFTIPLGEISLGSLAFYDSETGLLVAHVGQYCSFNSNPKWNELPHTKHVAAWQPKFVPEGPALSDRLPEGDIGPAELLAALERPESGASYACHAVEFTGSIEPDRTFLSQCLDYVSDPDAQTEYWLVADDEETARTHFEAFHHHPAALRFDCLGSDAQPSLESGLLRLSGSEIIFLHCRNGEPVPLPWDALRRLAVPGGLALVAHDEGEVALPEAGWAVLRECSRSTLLQAPQSAGEALDSEQLAAPRWVLGERGSMADDWVSLLNSPETVHPIPDEAINAHGLHMLESLPSATELRAIDFFCGDDPDDPTGESVVGRLVAFVQALVSFRIEHADATCLFTVVTRRAVHDPEDPRGSGLWGAVRSMAAEVGEEAGIDFRLVDVGEARDLETLALLAGRNLREREFAIRQRRLWVPRVVSLRERYSPVPEGAGADYQLALDNPGQISGLQFRSRDLPEPGASDVEIEISATALNFRDIMVTLGLLPALAYERSAMGREVGMEGSGVVRRVGAEVKHCRVGDEVIFTHGGSVANRVMVDGHRVFAKPACLTMDEAAAVLSVYVTAYYSLIHLARLGKGQRVLIHSAMGGVGQAAMALARHAGAEIYATAGSQGKRERLIELGAAAAFDSHSFDWHEELMSATGGEGVDVVLNSLAGRHIDLCLKALRPSGWHCEIGKVDIYADNDLGMRVFRKNLRFAAIDMDRLMIDEPVLSRDLSRTCLKLIEEGSVPPLPVTTYSQAEYPKALRRMTAGRHEGKLILKSPGTPDGPDFPVADMRPFLDPEATYLVTGAMGGFGPRVLSYLAASGARHFTLMDRDPERRRDAGWVRRSTTLDSMDIDVEIDIVSGDVSKEVDVRRCIAQIKRPLKGVFHLAGTLDDRLLADTSRESVTRVFAPKARGALHLHSATSGIALDHFVMFSSISASFGNFGQINYSAANAFVDGLIAWRRRQGLPGLSYSLAAVAEVGMAARNIHLLRMMRSVGTPPVSSDTAIGNLDYALRNSAKFDHLLTILFTRPPWTFNSPDYMRTGRLMNNQDAFEVDAAGQLTIETVVSQIAERVAELCGHEEGSVEEPLSAFGLTSISVAELGTFIQTQFNYQVSALELMTTATCMSLARAIVHGDRDDEDELAEIGDEGASDGSCAPERPVRRTPSAFANDLADHFRVVPLPVPEAGRPADDEARRMGDARHA